MSFKAFLRNDNRTGSMRVKENAMRRVVCMLGVAALALVLTGASTTAEDNHDHPCDFLTGGGWIVPFGAKANFGVGGGCKHGLPTWGHLNYIDRGAIPLPTFAPLHVHWMSITAYFPEPGEPFGDPRDPKRTGTRFICGTARTNQLYGDVYFAVRARDAGEPGVNDEFDIQLRDRLADGSVGPIVYTTDGPGFPHRLGGGTGGGGNIQLHKPNPSTTGFFGGPCPALTG